MVLVVFACNISAQDVEAGGKGNDQGYFWVHSEFENSVGYRRPCLTNKTRNGQKVFLYCDRSFLRVQQIEFNPTVEAVFSTTWGAHRPGFCCGITDQQDNKSQSMLTDLLLWAGHALSVPYIVVMLQTGPCLLTICYCVKVSFFVLTNAAHWVFGAIETNRLLKARGKTV